MVAALIAFDVFTVGVMAYAMARHEWVLNVRERLIRRDYRSFRRLPSYGAMLGKFWIWDVRQFDGASR